MDLITKIFLCNLLVVGVVLIADYQLFNAQLEKIRPLFIACEYWMLASLISIPCWTIYSIWILSSSVIGGG